MTDTSTRARTSDPLWYVVGLAVIAAAGLAVRFVSILVVRPTCNEDIVASIESGNFTSTTDGKCFGIWGDTAYSYLQGRQIARGNWFIDSYTYLTTRGTVFKPSSGDPPLFAMFLGLLSKLGITSGTGQRLACGVLGVIGVVLIAMLARRIAGPRAGLLAGAVAAVYPLLWINDGMLLSESLYVPLIALAMHLAYRFWDRPTFLNAGLFSGAIALAALTRAEALILFVAMTVPLLWGLRTLGVKRLAGLFATMAAVGLVLVGPWLAFNLVRFKHPALMTSATGAVLSSANCDVTYYGDSLGYYGNCFDDYVQKGWMLDKIPTCDEAAVAAAAIDPRSDEAGRCWPNDPALDETERDQFSRDLAIRYMSENKRRLPVVMLARVGRMWDFYVPQLGYEREPLGQNVFFNWYVEGRGKLESETGVLAYYALWPFAIGGFVAMWRRRVPLSPMISMAVVITVTAAFTFGITRYRVPIDVVMILLAAVGGDALLRRWWPASSGGTVVRRRGDGGGPVGDAPDRPVVPDLVPADGADRDGNGDDDGTGTTDERGSPGHHPEEVPV